MVVGGGAVLLQPRPVCVSVCVYTASGDQALLLSRKCQLLQEEKTEKKNVQNNGEKPIFIFTGRILLLFFSASSVCKIDITLYIISFFGKVLQAVLARSSAPQK